MIFDAIRAAVMRGAEHCKNGAAWRVAGTGAPV